MLAARQPANVRLHELLARSLLLSGREAELIERFGRRCRASRSLALPLRRSGRSWRNERLGDRAKCAPSAAAGLCPAGIMRRFCSPQRAGLPQATSDLRARTAARSVGDAQAAVRRLRARFPQSADIAPTCRGCRLAGQGCARCAQMPMRLRSRVRRPWSLTRKAAFAYRAAGDEVAADHLACAPCCGRELAYSGAHCALAEFLGPARLSGEACSAAARSCHRAGRRARSGVADPARRCGACS